MMIADISWWASLNTIEQIFWGIAIVFSVLFIIQFGLSLFGLDFDADADVEVSSAGSDYAIDPSFALTVCTKHYCLFYFFRLDWSPCTSS